MCYRPLLFPMPAEVSQHAWHVPMDTCLDGQDAVKAYLNYFNIPYKQNPQD